MLISGIYDFVGDRRFGGVKRQASVMSIASVAESVSQAKCGDESFKAHTLSYQFKNLCRGESFAKEQMAKWKHPDTGLKKDELLIIESLAYDAMQYFGYEAAYVQTPEDGKNFNPDLLLLSLTSKSMPLTHFQYTNSSPFVSLYHSTAIHQCSGGRV